MMPYIVNVGLILMGCIAFYKLLLQKETFYRLNRYVLMLCLLVAFSLPLLRVPQQLSLRKTEASVVITNNIPAANKAGDNKLNSNTEVKSSPVTQVQTTTNTFSWQQVMRWAILLYWFVLLFR